MQIGDLVCWYSKGIKWSYAEDIANPGIVLDIKEKMSGRRSFFVRCNDGKLTHEHECYIMLAEEMESADVESR